MTDTELLAGVDELKSTMVSVATGGPRIDELNAAFQTTYDAVDHALASRNIENPFPYRDLWQWYGRWSSDLPTWASRRAFVSELVAPLITQVRTGAPGRPELTGWARVDRTIGEARNSLARAKTEEQFQTVGLLCREALISVAQEVYVPNRHVILDDVRVSATDFKRLIEAYIAVELKGGAAEEARRHARTALDLALRLQHQRTASFRDAAICMEATASVVNIVAIVSGRRNP